MVLSNKYNPDYMFNTPILFLVFNRPDTTKQVFERIKEVKPTKLYIAADGPRENKLGEKELVEQTRQMVIKGIDWPCEVKTLFRDENLGCGKAVSTAIDWFFENNEYGIILEDDILVDLTFFLFCENMLSYYIDDERIMMISGLNIANSWKTKYYDYIFANYGSVWGWATWKRAWKHYDFNLSFWANEFERQQFIKMSFLSIEEQNHRIHLYNELYTKKIDTWDYQWTVAKLRNNGLTIIPTVNLVKNIGFSLNATHTLVEPEWAKLELHTLANTRFTYRKEVFRDTEYDNLHVTKTMHFNTSEQSNLQSITIFVKRIVKSITSKFKIASKTK